MKVEVFTHKNCIECNILLEYLENKGLLGKVQIIDTELYPFIAFERGVISTPSIFVDGKLIYAGNVDLEEFERILKGDSVVRQIDKNTLVEKLMLGIVDSFAATAWLYVNRDFDSFLAQKDFIYAVTGLVFLEKDTAEEYYNYLRNVMLKEGDKYMEEWKPKFLKNISSNFIRELYWLYEKKISKDIVSQRYPIEVFAHWLMIRGGSVGRVGLRIHPLSDNQTMSRVLEVYKFMLENYDELWEKVEREQKEIKARNREQIRYNVL
ncbi:thioredoxin [Sulfolobus sp. A20]|uniref:thioredoxin family protein n=1 Tax=Saccharolobus sp. A20 TaxID=1891280 RepID=UPI000845F6A4|nr:thioredoxin family protein [Sulfolobus sp. A20]TRM76635.1 thioredoxin [Sulfolobus sp. A20-N-F8]TRM79285.1 thioredoxin [Sulfolobus sp. B5]TRM81790.1 thioredoxin [Sulfolobus sp. A20-N-F6]TRM84856.1 thioredoxin [Sulfolobus sp. F3]AOL16066.1 thioredoxin [Sulfolobus sp. A20]